MSKDEASKILHVVATKPIVEEKSEAQIEKEKYEDRKKTHVEELNERVGKILNIAFDDNTCLQKVATMIEREELLHDKKIQKIDEKIEKWKEKDPQYSFVFKSLQK